MLKNLVYLAIFTTFTIAVWIGLTIYHNFSTTTISEVAQIQIVPIDSTFNQPVVQNLKKRTQVQADLSQTLLVASDPDEETSDSAALENSITTPITPPSSLQEVPGAF